MIKTLRNQIFFVYLHCNYKERNMVEQLHTLFAAMVNKTNVETKSPLVRVGLAVINHTPDIDTSQMPLSSFNVLLSENHEKCRMPVVEFPTTNKDTDIKNSITSAIEDFIITESRIDTNLVPALKYIVDENIDNITEHADTAAGYVCATWDDNAVTICIADAGKTIYGSYVDGNFEQISSDQSALQAAISGVSTKNRPGAENRGYGISTSADMIVRGLESTLVILSGRGLLFHNGNRSDFTELPEAVFMPGTLVSFTIPTHKEGFNLYDYIGG